MNRYEDDNNYGNQNMRQKDLVLATNEFVYVQDKTSGSIRTYTGPTMLPISQQQALVIFDPETKEFKETNDFNKAKQLFISAPEGWYIVLKNPAENNVHPNASSASDNTRIEVGKKINISGPTSFSLYPGQMAKVIQGHRLRSNQYLLARVYDAEAAQQSNATIVNTQGETVENQNEDTKYFVGQLLVIKGTEVSFYIPPTGIEVLSIGNKDGRGNNNNSYIRDAVTLERLEYAILKDENGEKVYHHGPAVVFPKPTETFVETPQGGNIFRALELSPISGIYVKVIAEYDETNAEGKKIHHPVGEELFITGNEQMIYYPRPEHALIQYDGKYMHHAIAIPEGEGRYILNRKTGEITTVKGPRMYLADPRTEVVVKRKLTNKECRLIYPNNEEVLNYNESISEQAVERAARKGLTNNINDVLNMSYCTSNQLDTLAIFEANANISRGTSYTKPRTITLDTKFEGAVSVDVWTGYAINVVSKTGTREVVVGPTTKLLNYDETLEFLTLSTGCPKTTDHLLETAYLRIENNKISDLVNLQTKDFVNVGVKVSYCVDFLEEYKDKWFKVENYIKYLCDRERSLLKREAKKYTIEEFYTNVTDIVRNVALDKNKELKENERSGRFFVENGMLVHDVEVLSVSVEDSINDMLIDHQEDMIAKTLEFSNAQKKMELVEKLAEYEKKEKELEYANRLYELELKHKLDLDQLEKQALIDMQKREEKEASKQAEADLQKILDAIQEAELKRNKKSDDARIAVEKELTEIETRKEKAYAATVSHIMKSIQPELVAALNAKSNADIMETLGKAVSPYAIAEEKGVADVISTLLRGTTLEETVKNIGACKI